MGGTTKLDEEEFVRERRRSWTEWSLAGREDGAGRRGVPRRNLDAQISRRNRRHGIAAKAEEVGTQNRFVSSGISHNHLQNEGFFLFTALAVSRIDRTNKSSAHSGYEKVFIFYFSISIPLFPQKSYWD